jgi:DNA-binding XRE family transcriptional regulator
MKSDKTHIAPAARRHARRGDNADLLALASAVRAARTDAGLTQAQLALVSGVGRDTVIALENARPGVALGSALRVMKGLGLTLAPIAVKR